MTNNSQHTVIGSRISESPAMNAYAVAFGCTLTLFLLVGRWTLNRAIESGSDLASVMEPRSLVTGLLALIAIASIGSAHKNRGQELRLPSGASYLISVYAFLLYMAFSCNWSVDPVAASDKLYETGLMLAVLVSLNVIAYTTSLEDVLKATLFSFSAAVSIMVFAGFALIDGGRVALLGGGPNVFARNIAVSVPAILFLVYRRGGWTILLAFGFIAISLMLLIATGSRGAALAFFAGFLYYLFHGYREFSTNVFRLLVMGTCVLFALFASGRGSIVIDQFQQRIVEKTIKTQYASGRDLIYADAWNAGVEYFPFGCGLNGFPAIGADGIYPHNLFLEAFAEGGLPAVLLLVVMSGSFIRSCIRSLDQHDRFVNAIVLILLVAAQFSGDLFDSRCVFICGALVGGATFRRRHRLFAQHRLAVKASLRNETVKGEKQSALRPTAPPLRSASRAVHLSLRERINTS